MCPDCNSPASRVTNSRPHPGLIRRRRICENCNCRYTTYETTALPEPRRPLGEELSFLRSQLLKMADRLKGLGAA